MSPLLGKNTSSTGKLSFIHLATHSSNTYQMLPVAGPALGGGGAAEDKSEEVSASRKLTFQLGQER